MLTKLIQFTLVGGSLAGTVLLYLLLIRFSEIGFTVPAMLLLIGVVAAYLYGATVFMAFRGIHFFTRSK